MKVFSQCDPPLPDHETPTSRDLAVLDKVSITKVTEFMHRFQEDASFTPPTLDVMYDSEKIDLDIDSEGEVDSIFIEAEDMNDEITRARNS